MASYATPRMRTYRAPPQFRARGRVEGGHDGSAAQYDMQAPRAVFDDAPGFVSSPQRNRYGDLHRVEIDDDQLVAVGSATAALRP